MKPEEIEKMLEEIETLLQIKIEKHQKAFCVGVCLRHIGESKNKDD
jgi:hypothetical protein